MTAPRQPASVTHRLDSAHPFDAALAFLGDRLRVEEPLAALCTYRVGGAAARFVVVKDESELNRIAAALAQAGAFVGEAPQAELSVHVIGRGSNVLVADAGMPGLVLQLGDGFAGIEILDSQASGSQESPQPRLGESDQQGSRILRAGAMASLPVVARKSVAAGLTGFEWAVGVPGSIGGAVRMNAGGHGADMAASLTGVRVLDLETGENRWVTTAALELGYRHSAITSTQLVLNAELQLASGDRALGEQRLAEIVSWRREHQPGGHNAGSVFRNPPGDSAGRLIEAANCRGLRVGTAEVSTKHSNFIQTDPGGSADDVLEVMAQVVAQVASYSGVQLQAETVLLGFTDEQRSRVSRPNTGTPSADDDSSEQVV
jgi:UDP-N-acetylmuramate dehydrogenase